MGLFDWFRGSRRTTVILPTDIVVFIVGPTGSGKSWFMSSLLRNENVNRVSRGQRPGTTEVYAERCQFSGMQSDIVIVDTPSFCTYTEPDGERVVRKWMESKVARMLYMHNLAFNPQDANLGMANHLSVFRRTCRQNLFPGITHVVPIVGEGARLTPERLGTLMAQLRRQANAVGAQLHDRSNGIPFNGTPEMAWDIVQGLLSV